MKNIYKRKAWLLNDDIILEGYTAKRKFFPKDFECGFSYQRVHKSDIGKILFYDREEARKKIWNVH